MGGGAILTLLLLTPAAAEPLTGSDRELAERAADVFQKGCQLRELDKAGTQEFQTAAACYEELRRRGLSNAALYANLGDAYVLADDLPHAVLSYRRGLLLHPNDDTLLGRVVAARELVAKWNKQALADANSTDNPLGLQPVDANSPWLPRIAPEWLFLGGFAAYAGLCLFGTRWLMTRHSRWLPASTICLLAAGSLTVLVIDGARHRRDDRFQTLVVIKADGVLVRKGDGQDKFGQPTYPPRYDTPLYKGVEARLLHERGPNWVQIELVGGEVGWVPRRFVLIDRQDAD